MAETIPLFPLGTVLLPGVSLPLHIFEPRYRQLTVDLMTGAVPGRSFGVVSIKQGWDVVDDVESMRTVGCSALLREARRLPDGRFDIVTRGERRFRLLDVDDSSAPYLLGEVEWLPDAPAPTAAADTVPVLADAARSAHQRYCAAAWQQEDWTEPPADTEPETLAYVLASDCLLAVEDRQRLLEETSVPRRLRLVRRMLNREAGILSTLHAVPAPLVDLGAPPSLN
ncbi:peptidase [Solihabitans fulvus]|uniref:Peptidase n=1 Tax=Solihabitans fulvus TaxID=1892852 RepID=A0A5B2X646_9PSEU|nr:LON peptidase substrate-binding domain-containing protein [Solihabitans fulvus]KAA2258703.1 peptidase [Solihabitans fulvus]